MLPELLDCTGFARSAEATIAVGPVNVLVLITSGADRARYSRGYFEPLLRRSWLSLTSSRVIDGTNPTRLEEDRVIVTPTR